MQSRKISILGTVGVPANYGGFETLAENLVRHHDSMALTDVLTVYCSGKSYPTHERSFLSAKLKYIPLNANGAQSIPYDIWSLFSAVWNRSDVILLLGVSGAVALPLVRLFSSARIVTNIDGIEWRREKWQGLAKRFLRFSEKMAVRFSHEVVADNAAIAEYVQRTYGVAAHVIAYGGDHAMAVEAVSVDEYALPEGYAFSVCRIEPENNVHVILEAFSKLKPNGSFESAQTLPPFRGRGRLVGTQQGDQVSTLSLALPLQGGGEGVFDGPGVDVQSLVMVGNWANSEYGRALRAKYASCANLYLLDPIYDLGKLKTLRAGAALYVHGHSAGGTNPSLVEAMHFGKPILAFDCDFNRATTEDKALFFADGEALQRLMLDLDRVALDKVGQDMLEIANRRYTWNIVAQQYFALMQNSLNQDEIHRPGRGEAA